jgi:NAD(P)H-dependent FMN reductase
MLKIAVVIGSTRPNRVGPAVASWVVDVAQQIDAPVEIVDVADVGLPLLDEAVPAALSPDYSQAHTRRWGNIVSRYDGFVFVTPEYNHSLPASLKNALDFVYREWNTKAAGVVSYGIDGGVRAADHLRLVCAELQMATVRTHVALSLFDDFEEIHRFAPRQHHSAVLLRLLDEVIAWSGALNQLRQLAREPSTQDRDRVVVVGRARWKLREALRVLRGAGFSAVGTLDGDEAAAAIDGGDGLLAVVLGGSVGPELERSLRARAASRGAQTVRTAIGHTDPGGHFTREVLPQLEHLRRHRQRAHA